MTRKKKKLASLTRRLHRTVGAVAALFVLFIVISGLGINHAAVLGFEKHHITQPFLLDWYGIGEPEDLRSFTAGDHWLSFAGSGLYFDGTFVATLPNGRGALSNGAMLIAAGDNELLLLDHEGELVERMPWSQKASGTIKSVGLLPNGFVAVRSGQSTWLADKDLLQWRVMDENNTGLLWSQPTTAPESIRQAVSRHFRGDGLNLERLLLDLHSGRFFGPGGVLIYDLLALAIGFLAISGLVLWMRGRRNGKKARSR